MSERAGSGWDCICRLYPRMGECDICSEYYAAIRKMNGIDPIRLKKVMDRILKEIDNERYKRVINVVDSK